MSRTRHYLIDEFNKLYQGRLSRLPAWKDWTTAIMFLDEVGIKAFAGELNLHDYSSQINDLNRVYARFKEEYFKKYRKSIL